MYSPLLKTSGIHLWHVNPFTSDKYLFFSADSSQTIKSVFPHSDWLVRSIANRANQTRQVINNFASVNIPPFPHRSPFHRMYTTPIIPAKQSPHARDTENDNDERLAATAAQRCPHRNCRPRRVEEVRATHPPLIVPALP